MKASRALGLLLALLLSSCGAYFNTYYNAREAFDEGVKQYEQGGERSSRNSFDTCLRVSSKLLQFYPESRWVDDTILLIGKCYVYMDQHHRALRKFDELEAQFPDSRLLVEARIWRARSLLALSRMDACQSELARLRGTDLSREQLVELNKVYAELYASEDNLERFIAIQEEQLSIARKRSDKAAINLELAQSYEAQGNWELALRHYGNARRYRPNHALLLQSWLGSVDNLIRLQRLDLAQRRLKKLNKDERFFEERHRIRLREAWLAEARGRQSEAQSIWRSLLEEFKSTESSAAAAWDLGRDFLLKAGEVDSAEVYFKRAKQEKGGSLWADSSQAALELLVSLRGSMEAMDELEQTAGRLRNQLIPDSARLYAAQSLLNQLRPRLLDSLRRADTLASAADSSLGDSLQPELAEVLSPVETPPGRNRNEGHSRSKSRLFDFSRKEREAARQDSLREVQLQDSLRQVAEARRLAVLDSTWTLAILDTLGMPQIDSLSIMARADSVARLLVEERFTYADLQARKLARPVLADSLFRALLEDSAASDEQAARLYYAYGRLRVQQFEDSSGYDWFRRLVERWPLAAAANPARAILGLPPAVTAEDSAAVLLKDAEDVWLSSRDLDQAWQAYLDCAERYPETEAAYTAWIALGVLALEDLENPSLAEEQFREAMRRFPDGPANQELAQRLGMALDEGEQEEEAELPAQSVELEQARQDDEGRFVDPNMELPLEQRLEALRERFESIGVIVVERVLE